MEISKIYENQKAMKLTEEHFKNQKSHNKYYPITGR